MNINVKTLTMISKIINKTGVSHIIKELNFDEKNREEIGKELIACIIDNIYKAEDELIDFIMLTKGVSKEDAENVNVIEFFSELFKDEKLKTFFKSM